MQRTARWRPIPDIEGFEVSDQGDVRNSATDHLMSRSTDGHGGLKVVIRKNKKLITRGLGKLVAQAFLGDPPDSSYVIAYKDNNPLNVVAENLLWVPRWHAQEWAFQERRSLPMRDQPIRMESTGKVYANSLECARDIRGIEKYIVLAAQNPDSSVYMGSHFRWVL
jgi:NUMOD4 motif.